MVSSNPPASPLVTTQYATSTPSDVQRATLPATPKSTSSGWAVTTSTRCTSWSSSTRPTLPGSAALGGRAARDCPRCAATGSTASPRTAPPAWPTRSARTACAPTAWPPGARSCPAGWSWPTARTAVRGCSRCWPSSTAAVTKARTWPGREPPAWHPLAPVTSAPVTSAPAYCAPAKSAPAHRAPVAAPQDPLRGDDHRRRRRPREVDPLVGAPPHVLAVHDRTRLLVEHGTPHVGDLRDAEVANQGKGVAGVGHVVGDEEAGRSQVDQAQRRREDHREVQPLVHARVVLDVHDVDVLHA